MTEPGARMSALQQAIMALYAELDAEIAQAKPVCRACGECCDFPRQDYVLYATTAEVELAMVQGRRPDVWERYDLCPFHVGERCANRRGRPLGCRTYYCKSFEIRGPLLYARFHDRLKAIIVEHGHDYRYAPFLDLLAEAWRKPAGGA